MDKEYQFDRIAEADFEEIETLAINNGGNSNLSAVDLKHQYFNNPTGSFSLWKAVRQNKIEGYATTNNFNFILENKQIIAGVPQNVLVSEAARGSGLFGRLYNFTETENRGEKNIDTFLTFTNRMSTPIFLKKFGYMRGQCPDLIFYIPSFQFLKNGIKYTLLKNVFDVDFENFNESAQLNNAFVKNKAYYLWRYKRYTAHVFRIVKVIRDNKIIGFGILKIEKKRGVSFLMLMDIIFDDPRCVFDIINVCRHYCSKNLFAGLLLFKLPDTEYPESSLKLTIKHRFNFLVKGKNSTETEILSQLKFNFFLGDMDSL